MCDRCDAESADYAAKATAAYAANGWPRIVAAIRHEDELADSIRAITGVNLDTARVVIDAVREFDERTLAMREAKDDHTAQNNERPY